MENPCMTLHTGEVELHMQSLRRILGTDVVILIDDGRIASFNGTAKTLEICKKAVEKLEKENVHISR
jgi:hypothetical protein